MAVEGIFFGADAVLEDRLGDDRFLVPLLLQEADLLDAGLLDLLDVLFASRRVSLLMKISPVFLSTTSLQIIRPS